MIPFENELEDLYLTFQIECNHLQYPYEKDMPDSSDKNVNN